MTSLAVTQKGFQQAAITLARLFGWRVHYTRDSRGWPDLVLCRDGVLVFRELKTDRGHLTLEQEEWGDLLTRCGVDWAVWRPSDWARIETTLRGQLSLEVAS